MIITHWLSDIGEAATTRRIREEKRKDIERRVRLMVTILTALTGISGIIVGILAFLKSSHQSVSLV